MILMKGKDIRDKNFLYTQNCILMRLPVTCFLGQVTQ